MAGHSTSSCRHLLLLLLPLAITPWCAASIASANVIEVDFRNPADAASKASWSDNLDIKPDGLGWDGKSSATHEGWIQTKPLATGLSWRPAVWTGVRVTISPEPQPIQLANGKSYIPFAGQVYVRYSPDLLHWSDWQALTQSPPPEGWTFKGALNVPTRERKEYLKRLDEYQKLDVPWTSDEDAAVRWVVSREPDFFARWLPFVGYVEFLFEGPFYGGKRISSLHGIISYGLSGMSSIPRDPNDPSSRDMGVWSFDATKPTRPKTPARLGEKLRELK